MTNTRWDRIWVLFLCTVLLLGSSLPPVGATRAAVPDSSATVPDALDAARAPDAREFTATFLANRDTFVNDDNPTTNYGLETYLQVLFSGTVSDLHLSRTLLGFDVSSLPDNAVVVSASLELYSQINRDAANGIDAPLAGTINSYSIDADWGETTVTYNTRPTVSYRNDPGSDYVPNGWTTFDVTNIVSGWVSDAYPNYGIWLTTGSLVQAEWWARQTIHPPKLTVVYTTAGSPLWTPVTADTWVSEAATSENHGSDAYLTVGRNAITGNRSYALLKFDISDLPANASVTDARLELYSEYNRAPTAVLLYPDALLSDWSESTVTWNTKPSSSYRGDPYATPVSTGWTVVDVTNIVQDWTTGALLNYGIQLRPGRSDTSSHQFYALPSVNAARLIVSYEIVCNALSSVTIGGATQGVIGVEYTFNATLAPAEATTPITVTWTATDQTPVVGQSASFTWTTTGLKTITATAENCAGSVVDTHQVLIETPPPACDHPLTGLSLDGPAQLLVSTSGTFTATAGPTNATQPITYTWQASELAPRVVVDGVSSSEDYGWATPGGRAITVTAQNCGGVVQQVRPVQVVTADQLPDLSISDIWYEPDVERIGFAIHNTGGSVAPAGTVIDVIQGIVPYAQATFATDLQPGAARAGFIDAAWTCTAEATTVQLCADATGLLLEGDETNNCFDDLWACDPTPPVITSGPTVDQIGEDSARISWTTNEPCTSELRTSAQGYSYSPPISNYTPTTNHQVTVSGLDAGRPYRYQVWVTDGGGNTVNSPENFFETLPPGSDPPEIVSLEIVPADYPPYEFYFLRAVLADTLWTDRVTFFLNGQPMGSDYTADPYFEVLVSPYDLGYNRAGWAAPQLVFAQATSTGGASSSHVEYVTPDVPPRLTVAYVRQIEPNNPLYVPSSPAPAGTTATVNVWAAAYEWGCYSESLVVPPAGLNPVNCFDVRHEVDTVKLLLDGAQVSTYSPAAGELSRDVEVQLGGKTVGAHTLTLQATVTGEGTTERTKTLTLAQGSTYIDVTRQMVRSGNYYQVTLTLENIGNFAAQIRTVTDNGLVGLQPLDRVITPNTLLSTSYSPATQRASVTIWVSADLVPVTLDPGEQLTVRYAAVPVLVESPYPGNDLDFSAGYEQGGVVSMRLVGASAWSTWSFYEPWVNFDRAALAAADYLLVTNPSRLFALPGSPAADVNSVLASMAHLAALENGVLGYISTYDDGSILDDLIERGGDWAAQLHPNFSGYEATGYLLIVGEQEVVPAQGAGYGVNYSDLRYASNSGEAKPELVQGRIVGNSPAALLDALQTTLDVLNGVPGHTFDRSHAFVYSGRGEGESIFWDDAKAVRNRIEGEFDVTLVRGKNYDDEVDLIQDMQTLPLNKDLVLFSGHGNPDGWFGMWSSYADWIAFGDAVPVVVSLSCSAGNYEDPGDDDYGIVEALFGRGAGAVIASVDTAHTYPDSDAARSWSNRWDAGESAANAMTDMKRDKWSIDSDWKMWAYEYHLFGDPKYGMTMTPGRAPAVSLGSAELQIHVPTYVITTTEDGLDAVEIPGGEVWIEDGQYRVPFWAETYSFPAGQSVQSVTLDSRSDPEMATGLDIPTTTQIIRAGAISAAQRAVLAADDWFPTLDSRYRWLVESNPDGSSTLTVIVYPFYYQPATGDALFYSDYTFAVETLDSTVSILALDAGDAAHPLNAPVTVTLALSNTSAPLDLFVRATVTAPAGEEPADGLPLVALHSLTETASVDLVWDSSGFDPGFYTLDVELLDAAGAVLARQSGEFQLGVAAGQVEELTAAPALFQVGDPVSIAATLHNTGDVPLTGTARVQIVGLGALTTTLTFTETVSGLAPGATLPLAALWDTAGAPQGDYLAVVSLVYQGRVSNIATARFGTRVQLFLPAVLKY